MVVFVVLIFGKTRTTVSQLGFNETKTCMQSQFYFISFTISFSKKTQKTLNCAVVCRYNTLAVSL